MSDPWEYERKRLEDPTYGYQDSGGATSDGRRILTDADALLAVVRATRAFKNHEWTFAENAMALGPWGEVLTALAALQEHLRGDNNELSSTLSR